MMERADETPPENMLENIRNGMESYFVEWQKNIFEKNEELPAGEIWDNIRFSIDSDNNWIIIKRFLQKQKIRYWTKKVAIAAFLILIIGSSIYLKLTTVNNSKIIINKQLPKIEQKTENHHRYHVTKQERTDNLTKTDKDSYQQVLIAKNNVLKTQSKDSQNNTYHHKQNRLVNNVAYPANLVDMKYVPANNIPGDRNNAQLNYREIKKQRFSSNFKFYIGNSYAISNSWIINPNTYDGLKATSSRDTKLSFGNSFGFVAGYGINSIYLVELGGIINETISQNYTFFNEGKYYSQHVKFKISKANIILKRKWKTHKIKNIEFVSSRLIGIYAGNIRQIDNSLSKDKYFIKSNYHKTDFGAITGLESEIFIGKNISFIAGIRLNISTKNIFKGNEIIPSYFNNTHLMTVGVNTGIIYHFKK